MNTRCPPKRVPSATRFFTLCRLTVQPPQSYSVGGQRSPGQLTGKPAGGRPDYKGRLCAVSRGHPGRPSPPSPWAVLSQLSAAPWELPSSHRSQPRLCRRGSGFEDSKDHGTMEKGVPEPGPAAQRGGPPTTGGASHHPPGEDGPGGKAPARRDASWQWPQEAEDRPGSGTAGEPRAELGPRRRAQPSAFPSAQAWDSDSEKETLEGSAHRYLPRADSGGAKMNTRCPPKRVPSAARFFTLCRLTVQPPQSYSVGGQCSPGQLTGKPAGGRPDYKGRLCAHRSQPRLCRRGSGFEDSKDHGAMEKGVPEPGPAAQRGGPPTTGGASHHPPGEDGPGGKAPARRDASWQWPQEAEDRPGSGTAGEPRAELGPRRRAQPSAFPSAQAWDSDSEKETLEEEELQHFSNPHGLASHSPEPHHKVLDVWQKPIRPDSEGSTAPEHLLTTLSNSPGTKGLRGGSEQHPRSNSTSPSPSGEQEEEGSSRTTPVTSKHLSSGALRSATGLEEPDPESETSRDVKAAATDDPKSTKINDATSSQGRTNEEGEPDEEVRASPVKVVFPETAKPKDEKEHLGKERWGRASPCSGSSEATSESWLETGEEEEDVYSFPRSDRGSPPSLSWPPSTFPETRKQVPSMRAGTAGGTEREEEEEEEEEEQEEEELGAIVTNKPSRPSPEKSSLKGESRTPNWDSRDPISKGTASAASRSAGSGFEVGRGRYGYSISAEEPRGREEDEDEDEDGGEEIEEDALSDEAEQSVFTCVECSIYFKKQVHLQEHMLQHCRAQQGKEGGAAKEGAGSGGGGAGAGAGEFCCPECGWEFEDRGSLGQHRRRHRESREKIMEEIRKLNEFPDEGSEPRLHCPKCRFGTNSSKVFVEHAKMHIKERNERARDRGYQPSPLGLYRPVNPSSAIPYLPLKERYACQICSFPAPNESILREHMKYTHSHRLPWGMDQLDESEESLPGTSKDSYSLAKPYPSPTKTPSIPSFDGVRFGPSSGLKTGAVVARDSPFRTQTPIRGGPFGQRSLGVPTALKGGPYRPSVQQGPDSHQPLPKRKEVAFKSIGNRRSHAMPAHPGMGSPSGLSWPDSGLENRETQEMGGDEASSGSEFEDHVDVWFPEQLEVPQRALELKWELVRSRMHSSSSSSPPLLEHLLSCHPGDDCFLDDFQEEGAGSEPGALRSVERKCPYCPDRFHNGIGLANHVRGHLNRVGVSYNVRHFISPEEVNAIEQKFSYQKKKKKVANFDPDTFSLMRCEFCSAGFDTRAGLSSHARAHLRDFGITNWEVTVSPINILRNLFSSRPDLAFPRDAAPPHSPQEQEPAEEGPGSGGSLPRSPFTSPWTEEPGPLFSEGGEEDDMSAVEVPSPETGVRSETVSQGDPSGSAARVGPKPPAEAPGGREDPQDIKHTLKEIGCEFCGEYFENRKGLSSHARSHLRQLGITEWTVNGSPIDTLRELIKRKGLPSALPSPQPPTPPTTGHKLLPKPQRHLSHPPRPRLPPPPSTPAPGSPSPSPRSPTHSTPPSSSPSPSLLRKLPFGLGQARKMLTSLKPEPVCLELGRERGVGGFHNDSLQGHRGWAGPDSILPLNLVADREPVRDIRCEFCGEYFENRKGLSSHSRSHLRQMGITEWTVNGSPIDTLREIMHKKGKPLIIKKEPGTGACYRGPPWEERGGYHQQHKPYGSPSPSSSSSSNKPQLQSSPPRLMKPGLGSSLASREVSLSPINGRAQGGFLSPLAKRPLQGGRIPPGASGEPLRQQGGGGSSSKSYVQTELSFKPKALSSPEKPAAAHMLPDASCELCGFYFENRKALASHARAHLRQFGVTEWCVNGSPIETLSAWMRSKPHKVAEVHRTFMQGGGPYPKKMRAASLPSAELDYSPPAVQRSPVGRQTPGTPLGKRVSRELGGGHWEMGRGPECGGVGVPGSPTSPVLHDLTTQHQLLHQQQQGARSELNIRSPRGFERRPPKHPAHLEGDEALERCPTAPRVRTIPSLVPKPPATPLVKILGNTYCLKCRFCDVQFVGPLSMQEDWIRHLQQHILEMNFPKSVPPLEESSPPAESTDTAAQVL
ncbi:UNVERIFIED_CONTAM: hypothetical protein FKN15_029013 [Acipenser sinensis]